jgi:tRNA A-37 threonylcarbamoyl transferase component Bud32
LGQKQGLRAASNVPRYAFANARSLPITIGVPSDADDLEQPLRDLPRFGTLVKDRKYRQIWRFEHAGKAYYLKFYPTGGYRDQFRRFFRGSPAMMEFLRLQWLQKAGIPAPRAVAVMMGFMLNNVRGDVVIAQAIEPSVQLDQLLLEADLRGEDVPNHRELTAGVLSIVRRLAEAGLGHEDLHLGNFLLHDGKLFLLDAYAVRAGGMRLRDLLMLGHSAARFITRTDMLRGWREMRMTGPLPTSNRVSRSLQRRFLESVTRSNRYFGRLEIAGWSGLFSTQTKYPHRWSRVSRLEVRREDWESQWQKLQEQIEKDQLPILKRSRSGDVLRGCVTLAGQSIDVIIKRPRRRYWYRYINEIGRGHRARRAWKKAWLLISCGLPTAWPMLLMEKRVAGYVVDAMLISELVPGDTLAHADLPKMTAAGRENLFRRTGRLLRQIERCGLSHFDAKASNWIVFDDEKHGPSPVLIDVDGIRRRNWIALGIERLLKSMRENPQYAPLDSLALCRGYAPFARIGMIGADPAEPDRKFEERNSNDE